MKKSHVESESIKKRIEVKTQKNSLSEFKKTNQTESTPLISISETKEDRKISFGQIMDTR